MDQIHDQWEEVEAVGMAIEMSDPNQPYSCATWGNNFDDSDFEPTIVNGGSPYYDWWGMFETTYVPAHAFIDHNMKVHYKTNSMNANTANTKIEEMLEDCGQCYVEGDLFEEYGQEDCCEYFGGTFHGYNEGLDYDEIYCEGSDAVWSPLCFCSGTVDSDGDGIADECDDCANMPGDPNDDMIIDILDIVTVVNIILNNGTFTDCQVTDANINGDFYEGQSLVNVQDIILIINAILGNRLYSDVGGFSDLYLQSKGDDLVISVDSNVDVSGLQLSFYTDHSLNISLNDNSSDVYVASNVHNGIQYFVGFSMDNNPFNKDLEITIEGGYYLSSEEMDVVLSTTSGNSVDIDWNLPELQSFSIDKMFPNPFNPSTEINYTVEHDGNLNIAVYNLLGQQVAELYSGYHELGSHKVLWNAENIPSGVYYVNITHENGQSESMKAVLLK